VARIDGSCEFRICCSSALSGSHSYYTSTKPILLAKLLGMQYSTSGELCLELQCRSFDGK
jgi:hypothetical protein